MSDTHRRELIWTHMASDVYETVSKCVRREKKGSRFKHKRHLQLFQATELLNFAEMDKFGPLPKTAQENQYFVVITDRCFIVTRAIPNPKPSETDMTNVFLEHGVVPLGIPSYLQRNKGPQFVSRVFASICANLFLDTLRLQPTTPQITAKPNCITARSSRDSESTLLSTIVIGT